MTSLAEQLKRLALPQTDPSLLNRSEAASLLFDCKEAAAIDRDTFFAIGCTGLEELMEIDPSFEAFQSSLFSSMSKGLERSVQTKAVNQQLNQNISLFLIHLSPYFMLKPAQKCLEWLINRFHIHLYNQDSLIGCVLPYHETKLFVRVIQLLNIKNPTNKWHWLDPIRVFSERTSNYTQLRVLLAFYASTIVSALGAAEKITDTIVSMLLPYIQKGLKSSVQDYRAATYMIICQMTVKVTVDSSLVHSLMFQISKTLSKVPSLAREGVACLNLLLQTQKGDSLGKKPFNHLCMNPELVTLLQGLSEGYDISPLLRYLLPHLISSIMKCDAEEQEDSGEAEDHIYIKHLEAILQSIPLEKDLDHLLASKFLEEFISYGTEIESNPTKMAAISQKLLPLIRLLERKYPKALDSVLEEHLEGVTDQANQNIFHQFISLSLSCGKYKFLEDSDTSLLLSLNHPQPAVRVLALQHLKDVIETSKFLQEGFDQSFIEEAIFGRLRDDNRDVVMSAFSVLEIFRKQVNPEVVVSSLLSIFQRADLSKDGKWYKVLERALQILVKEEILKKKKELLDEAVMQLLPFMVFTNANSKSSEWKMAVCLSESDLCSLHPLLKDWPEVLQEAIKSSKSAELVGVVNKKMILLFSKNMTSGDSSLLLQMETPSDWSVETIQESLVPVDLLTTYVEKLNSDQSVDAEESAIFVFLLRSFINHLKPPPSFPKEETWWNPESLNQDCKDYLHLLLGLFDLLVCGASEGSDAVQYRALMNLLLKVHLKDSEVLFKFLSVLWTYGFSLSNHLNYEVNAMLQTRALYIGYAVLVSQTYQKKKQLLSLSSPVVISLLINLGSPVSEVRRAALNCFHSLSSVKESLFHPVLQHLGQKMEEIISDPAYITQIMATLFEELQTQPKQKSQKKKLSEALESIIDCVQNPICPSYVARNLMKILHEVHGEMILTHLLPALDRLLEKVLKEPETVLKDEVVLLHLILGKFNEHSATLLCKNQQSLDLFVKSLHAATKICQEVPPFQITALGQITKPFFAALSDGRVQQKLLKVLFDLLLNCKNPLCAQTISSVFKGISVCAEQIVTELDPPGKSKSLTTVQQTRRQKMQQQKCLEPLASEEENMEYTKQLILTCLLNICQKLSPDGSKIPADILDKEKFNVELIVQCIRISKMPQTHHHALLLLGAVAGMFPDKVLHNIMPIFTFMGANVLRLDDTYTFQVINKTVQMVIPALIQAEDSDLSEPSSGVEEVVIKIIRVFVDALPHVPEHRRLPILAQLVNTVGGDRFLWVLLVLLFEQYVTKTVTLTASTDKDAVLEADTEFWISICCEFSVRCQFQSMMKIIQYLTELPENKEGPLQVDLVCAIEKVVECEETEELQKLEQRLLEDVLHYINTVASSVEGNADKPTAKFWRVLLNKSYDMLDKVNALLPTETFIPVIRGLMTNQLPSVRRKAMDLLNNKVQQRTRWQKSQVRQLLELVPELITIVQCKRKEEKEEQVINRQTALFSLKLLCKGFGTENPLPFVPVLKTAIDLVSSEKEEKNVMGSALLCIAEVTCTLKAQVIPQLPRLMPALLKTLKSKKELISSEIYLLSAVTALLKVAETLPHFLSPYLTDCLLQVVRLEKIVVEFGPSSQISLRVMSLKTILATKLAPRILLPAVTKCYSEVAKTRKNCLGPLMNVLKEHIIVMEKEHLISHQAELTAFFMKALDFRTEHAQDDLEEVGRTETYIIDCLISMVMKLSEASFRPLFFKLFDWSKTESALKDRLLTFHRLADCIADKLKGLFTLFAGHLVKPFAEMLNQLNISKTDEAFFDSENSTEKSCLLLQFTVDCLHKLFLFDTQKFLSKERAETLMMPLVDQVRFAALLALLEVAEKLKENYLVLLPESIPFLAELMEDECEEVGQQCQKTIQQLEVILGEPLQSYF
ncbi:hypothetical protein ASZ78_007402 [Callipepla squamata]|uniref:HEAT repeat-containing protein 1 n=1 Tax=Callipepla squamata TaxID=9009 RepID=A0A226MV56_CALSU|nr:hypothetical protein ASZ78_007402 [Callipepla squamata]